MVGVANITGKGYLLSGSSTTAAFANASIFFDPTANAYFTPSVAAVSIRVKFVLGTVFSVTTAALRVTALQLFVQLTSLLALFGLFGALFAYLEEWCCGARAQAASVRRVQAEAQAAQAAAVAAAVAVVAEQLGEGERMRREGDWPAGALGAAAASGLRYRGRGGERATFKGLPGGAPLQSVSSAEGLVIQHNPMRQALEQGSGRAEEGRLAAEFDALPVQGVPRAAEAAPPSNVLRASALQLPEVAECDPWEEFDGSAGQSKGKAQEEQVQQRQGRSVQGQLKEQQVLELQQGTEQGRVELDQQQQWLPRLQQWDQMVREGRAGQHELEQQQQQQGLEQERVVLKQQLQLMEQQLEQQHQLEQLQLQLQKLGQQQQQLVQLPELQLHEQAMQQLKQQRTLLSPTVLRSPPAAQPSSSPTARGAGSSASEG